MVINHDCDPTTFTLTKSETLTYFSLGIILTFICGITGYFWLKRIHCFPIRERSPYMSLMCLVYIWMNTMIIPINLMVYWFKSFNINEDSYYIKIMTFISFFTLFGIYSNYILRTIRLTYVIGTHYKCSCFDFIMKKEKYFFVLNIIIGCIYGVVGICIYDEKYLPFETVLCLQDFQLYEQIETMTTWEIFLCVNQFFNETFLILLVFVLKRIKSGYNIVKELVLMVIIMVVSNFLYYLPYHLLEQYIDSNLIILKVVVFVRNILLIYFSFIYTLIISHHGRAPTPTYIIFQELRYFLYDHTCVKVFHEYIKRHYPEHQNSFLFYLDFVSQRVNGRELFKEYFLNIEDDFIKGINNANLIIRLKEEYEQNEEFSFDHMIEVRDIIYENLEALFQNYKQTRSCKKLIDMFEYHDLITERLYAYNMESFSMQV